MSDTFEIFDDAEQGTSAVEMFPEPQLKGTGSETADQFVAGQVAILQSQNIQGKPSLETYTDAKAQVQASPNVPDVMAGEKDRYTESIVQQAVEAGTPENVDQTVQNIQTIQEDAVNDSDTTAAVVRIISNTDTQTEQGIIASQYLSALFIDEYVANKASDTFSDNLAEVGSMFIPTIPFDIADVTGGSVFNFREDWPIFVDRYKELAPVDKVRAAQGLVQLIFEGVDGDESLAIAAFSDFTAFTGSEGFSDQATLDTALAALDIIPIVGVAGQVTGKGLAARRFLKRFTPPKGATTAEDNAEQFVQKLIGKSVKEGNLVKRAKQADNTNLAGDINTKAMKGEEVPGVDQYTAQINTTGADLLAQLMPEATKGMGADAVRSLEKQLGEVGEALSEVDFEVATPITPAERADAQTSFLDDWEARIQQIEREHNIVVSSTPVIVGDRLDGFTVAVTTDTGEVLDIPVKYTTTDLGGFEEVATGGIFSKVVSPEVFLRDVMTNENIVNVATRAENQAARNIQKLSKAFQIATRGVNKKSWDRLNPVLLQGNTDGITYNATQLKFTGIETPEGVIRLTDKEVNAYVTMRGMFDWLHLNKADQIRRQLEFEGFQTLNLSPVEGLANAEAVFARPIGNSALDSSVTRVYDVDNGSITTADDSQVALKLESDAYTVVRFRDPVRFENEAGTSEWIRTAVVQRETLEPLPSADKVLRKREGYIPQDFEGVSFILRRKLASTIDGVSGAHFITEGRYTSRVEAEATAAKLGGDTEGYVVTRDREMPDGELVNNSIAQFGSMYGSARSSSPIVNGRGVTQVNAFKAMDRNLAHVANASSMNEFRMITLQKFLNTVGSRLDDPNKWQSPVRADVPAVEKANINRFRDWIREQLRIPTETERVFAGRVNNMLDSVEKSIWRDGKTPYPVEKLRNGFLDVTAKDPFAAARATAFHLLLGSWNPAQMLVQGFGAAPAIALDPLRAPMLLTRQSALWSAMAARRTDEPFTKLISGATNMNNKEFAHMVQRYDESGLNQAANANADYDLALDGFRIDGGVLRKAWKTNAIFFTAGEQFSRQYSYLLAYDDWIGKNKNSFPTKLDNQKIIDKALALTMNLSRANKADFQKGAISVPTLYWQVMAKHLETMAGLNRALTVPERSRIFLGQLAMFGANGAAIGGKALMAGVIAAAGIDLASMDENERAQLQAFLDGGGVEMFAQSMLGLRVDSGRFSLQRGVTDIFEAISDEDATFFDIISGAFKTIPSRTMQSFSTFSTLFAAPQEFTFTTGESLEAASILLSLSSTFRNAHQGYLWHKAGFVTDSKGNKLYNLKEGDLDAYVKAAGFQPGRVGEIYETGNFAKEVSGDIANVSNELSTLYFKALAGSISAGAYQIVRENLLQSLPTQQAREKAEKSFGKRVFTPGTKEEATWRKGMEAFFDNGFNDNGGQLIFNEGFLEGAPATTPQPSTAQPLPEAEEPSQQRNN